MPKPQNLSLKGGWGEAILGGTCKGDLKKEEIGRGGGAFSRGRLVWNHGQGGGRLLTRGPPS